METVLAVVTLVLVVSGPWPEDGVTVGVTSGRQPARRIVKAKRLPASMVAAALLPRVVWCSVMAPRGSWL